MRMKRESKKLRRNNVENVDAGECLNCTGEKMQHAIFGYRESWAGKNPEKVRVMNKNYWDKHKEEKKMYNKEYSQREIECEVFESKVRKCNWARHLVSRKHMLGGGGGKVGGDGGGGGG